MRILLLALLTSVALSMGCNTRGVDDRTAAFAATYQASCESHHDCATNQRCLGNICDLDDNACLSNDHCGSERCDAGYCALPSPALLTDTEGGFYTGERATPDRYLAAGKDGLVDNRGGLVLAVNDNLRARLPKIWWGEWTLRHWIAESEAPTTWRFFLTEENHHPERFIFDHSKSTAKIIIAARLLPSQSLAARTAPLSSSLPKIESALESGATFEDALVGVTSKGSFPIERAKRKADTIAGFEALRFEGVRPLPAGGGERFRLFLARAEFGASHYLIVMGLAAPNDDYTDFLDDFAAITETVRLAGVDQRVGDGL